MDARSRRNFDLWASELTPEELEEVHALFESPAVRRLIVEEGARVQDQPKDGGGALVEGIELCH